MYETRTFSDIELIINSDTKEIFSSISLTGVIPKLPELSEVLKTKELEDYYFKNKKEQPIGLIYVMESQFEIIKVGFTTNIASRLKALSRWEGELEVLLTIESSIELEQKFHKALKDTGEVFGYEWYPYSRKEEILDLVQNYRLL